MPAGFLQQPVHLAVAPLIAEDFLHPKLRILFRIGGYIAVGSLRTASTVSSTACREVAHVPSMSVIPEATPIYHITDVENLGGIMHEGGLHSDATIARRNPGVVIGYDHIKRRRLHELTVDCCDNRFVGEFVPFYFCPRSPMLLAVNTGKSGRPRGSQRTIVHLVSTLARGIATGRPWAVTSGNAGAYHTTFDDQLMAVAMLDWDAIRATSWAGRQHQKSAEFLLAEFFPWVAFTHIGCHNSAVAKQVRELLVRAEHRPLVSVEPTWYY